MKLNDFLIISAIFIVGFAILGVASYNLYFNNINLEEDNSDLNTAYLVSQQQTVNLDNQVTYLNGEVAARDNSIAFANSELQRLTAERDNIANNYDIGQQDLNNKIIEVLVLKDDVNKLSFDLNVLDANYMQLKVDYNFLMTNFDQNVLDIQEDYNAIRDNFKSCYWAANCSDDLDVCIAETDLNMTVVEIEAIQNVLCDSISINDYNAMVN